MKKIGTIYEERENCIIAKVYDRNEITDNKLVACFDMEKVHFFDVETTKRIRQEVVLDGKGKINQMS